MPTFNGSSTRLVKDELIIQFILRTVSLSDVHAIVLGWDRSPTRRIFIFQARDQWPNPKGGPCGEIPFITSVIPASFIRRDLIDSAALSTGRGSRRHCIVSRKRHQAVSDSDADKKEVCFDGDICSDVEEN